MEKLELERLFEAIRKDDLKSFSSVMLSKSDLNISFGRFPILSLLYLYGSYKILEKYERFLLPIHNFQVVEENYDAYLTQKYGDWRADLPKEQQIGHHFYEICDLNRPYTDYIEKLPNGKVKIINLK